MKKRELILDFTSLLDVIMILLFIVITNTSRVSAAAMQEAEDLQKELNAKQNISESYALYQSEAVIVTITNYAEAEKHLLRISQGETRDDEIIVTLGANNTENTERRITNYVNAILAEHENVPVYIVMHKSGSEIYKTEYDSLIKILDKLQKENKAVFYKITEEE